MPQQLPFFPLGTVVFPGDLLNLHIFEPRYRQLIHDCRIGSAHFGIPVYFDNRVQEVGMEMELREIVQEYPDGRLDVRTRGLRPFKLTSFENPWQGKLYAGGQVEWLRVADSATVADRMLLLRHVAELYDVMGIALKHEADEPYLSFKVGHKVGLSIRQEYTLLTLENERERIHFIIDYLIRNIPVVREMERTKQRIRMNGHFKNFDPLDF